MKYRYTMELGNVLQSKLLSYMEGTKVKMVMKVPVEVECVRSEEEQKAYLDSKIGEVTPLTEPFSALEQYEFLGYSDLVKVIE